MSDVRTDWDWYVVFFDDVVVQKLMRFLAISIALLAAKSIGSFATIRSVSSKYSSSSVVRVFGTVEDCGVPITAADRCQCADVDTRRIVDVAVDVTLFRSQTIKQFKYSNSRRILVQK